MNKNPWILTFLIFSLIAVPQAAALPDVELSLNTLQHPSDYISTCPDRVLDDIEVLVTNLGAQTDGVTLTLDWPEDMGFIKPYVMLAPGESKRVDPFWLTIPYDLEPGKYYATITAKSGMSSSQASKTITIDVMNCYGIDMQTINDYVETCSETMEPANYEFTIRNQGSWPETFDLSASVGWIEFSESVVSLNSGESRIIAASLMPPAGTGYQEVVVRAVSRDSYAQDSVVLKIDAKDCYDAGVELQPIEDSICLGEYAEYNAIITNAGNEDDDFSIETSADWIVAGQETVSIPVGESRIVEILAAPESTGISTFSVTVRSMADEGFVKTVTGAVNADDCRGVAVIAHPADQEVCRGDHAEYSVTIKNTGSVETTFQLSSTLGELESDAITLPAGASADVGLVVETAMIQDAETITVGATDGEVSDDSDISLSVRKCYDAELLVTPDFVYTCAQSEVLLTMTVANTGEMADVYKLEYNGESTVISLNAGDSGEAEYLYRVPETGEGQYIFTVSVSSEKGFAMSASAEINVMSMDDCYGVELSDGDGSIDVGKATTVELTIENKGQQADTWQISYDGPEWAYVEPDEITLEAGKSDNVYLYLSPLYGTGDGVYSIKIYADSDHSSDMLEMKANVPSGYVGPSENEKPPAGDNGTGWNESEFVPVDLGNETTTGDGITGEQILDRPEWKTMVVAAIAIIIILILVIRFAFLFKK